MKYIVMECHPGYAVVLDEQGQFRKVANMRYEVGQTITDVTEVILPAPPKKKPVRFLSTLAAAAACLVLLFTFMFSGNTTYASVYMTINPQVRIDVNRHDTVVGLEGVNEDGKALISGYLYQHKHLDLVVDELVDRAIEMGFLHPDGKISLALDAADTTWISSHGGALGTQLHDYLTGKITVTIEVTDAGSDHPEIPIWCDDDIRDALDDAMEDVMDDILGDDDDGPDDNHDADDWDEPDHDDPDDVDDDDGDDDDDDDDDDED